MLKSAVVLLLGASLVTVTAQGAENMKGIYSCLAAINLLKTQSLAHGVGFEVNIQPDAVTKAKARFRTQAEPLQVPEFSGFAPEEGRFLRHALDGKATARVLSMSSPINGETVTLSQYLASSGKTNFQIDALESPGLNLRKEKDYVIPRSMRHIHFGVYDALREHLPGRYDMIVARNFLGYFGVDAEKIIVAHFLEALPPEGYLVVDQYILKTHPEIFLSPDIVRITGLPVFQKK